MHPFLIVPLIAIGWLVLEKVIADSESAQKLIGTVFILALMGIVVYYTISLVGVLGL